MRKSRLSKEKQQRLMEHFVAGTTARCAANLIGVNFKTAAYYFHRLREIIYRATDRKSLTLKEGMDGITENAFLNIKNSSKTITANLELEGNDRGIILAQGGKFGGWALYMDEGKPAYTYNWFGSNTYTVSSDKALPKGSAEVKLHFVYDGGKEVGKGGVATIYVDGEKVAEGRIEKTIPGIFSADETAAVAKDDATQVADSVFKNVKDSEFTGTVEKVEISIPEK